MMRKVGFEIIDKVGILFLENLYKFPRECYIIHMFSEPG